MKHAILAILTACVIWAQQPDQYLATASTTALTVQQPSSQARQVTFGTGSVYCASAATATFSWNGTAATATAGTAKMIPGTITPASASVFTGSNVGSGTTGPVYNVPAASTMLFDMSWIRMGNTGSSTNVTITTSGTCTITIQWREQ